MAPRRPNFKTLRKPQYARKEKLIPYSTLNSPGFYHHRCRNRHLFSVSSSFASPSPLMHSTVFLGTHTLDLASSPSSNGFVLANPLPSDIIVEILLNFKSYRDLYNFICSSPEFYRLFDIYRGQILTQVAKNILGDAWEEATAVLVYHRNAENLQHNFAAVEKDLGAKFVLHRKDIPQLVANQKFFDSCYNEFAVYVSSHYPSYRPLPYLYYPLATVPNPVPAITPGDPDFVEERLVTPSFTDGDTLPIQLFYQMWLLSLQFTYERIETFDCHEHLSSQILVDLQVVSRVMYLNRNCEVFACSPRWEVGLESDGRYIGLACGLITIWGSDEKFDLDCETLIYMKMDIQLCGVTITLTEEEYCFLWAEMKWDIYESEMTAAQIAEKYGLDG